MRDFTLRSPAGGDFPCRLSNHIRTEESRTGSWLPGRWHQRCSLASHRRRGNICVNRNQRCQRCRRGDSTRAGIRRPAQRHPGRTPGIRKRNEVPLDGHQFQFRQHVQHGRGRRPCSCPSCRCCPHSPARLRVALQRDNARVTDEMTTGVKTPADRVVSAKHDLLLEASGSWETIDFSESFFLWARAAAILDHHSSLLELP